MGCKSVGIELDGELVRVARENAFRRQVHSLVEFRHENLLDVCIFEKYIYIYFT